MEAQFSCNRCRTLLSIPINDLGKRVLCPACDATFLVVADTSATVMPAPGRAEPGKPKTSRPAKPPQKEKRTTPEQPPAPVLSGCGPLLAFVGIFIVLTVLIIVGSQHRAANRAWVEFAGDKFKIEFPKQPVEAAPQPFDEGQVFTQALNHFQRTFAVATIDLGKAGDGAADKWLRWGEENLVAPLAKRGQVVRNREIKLGPHPGRELRIDNEPDRALLSRLYYVEGRLYHVYVDGLRRRRGPDRTVERFFGSFRLTE
jgi:hypothetical protein